MALVDSKLMINNFNILMGLPQVVKHDFERFDHIVALDGSNLADLRSICPEHHKHKLSLLLDHVEDRRRGEDVPDPYYGFHSFEQVYEIVECGVRGLFDHLDLNNNNNK